MNAHPVCLTNDVLWLVIRQRQTTNEHAPPSPRSTTWRPWLLKFIVCVVAHCVFPILSYRIVVVKERFGARQRQERRRHGHVYFLSGPRPRGGNPRSNALPETSLDWNPGVFWCTHIGWSMFFKSRQVWYVSTIVSLTDKSVLFTEARQLIHLTWCCTKRSGRLL